MSSKKKVAPTKKARKRKPAPVEKKSRWGLTELIQDGPSDYQSALFKKIFKISAVIIFLAMSAMSFKAGISGDEVDMNEYGKESLNFYGSFGSDTTAFDMDIDRDNAFKYYGAFFDVTAALLNKISPLSEYDTRHLLNSWVGFAAILLCAFIALNIAGWRAALIVLWLLFISPRFTGHSMNNPKDIPFAMSFMLTSLGLVQLMDEMPKPSKKSIILVICGIGIAIGTRIGGLMLFGYLGLFMGLDFLSKRKDKVKVIDYAKSFGIMSVGGYALGMLLWPYGLLSPLDRPLAVLERVSNLPISLRQLFEGQHIMSENLPGYYLPKYIAITNPIIVIVGFLIAIVLLRSMLKRFSAPKLALAFFGFVFPIAYIIYKDSNVFGGWRHVLFTYPYLVLVAGLAWEAVFRLFKKKKYGNYVVLAILVLGAIPSLFWTAKSTPHHYTYFNQLVGGTNGAYGEYETDYYYHSMREASEWLIESLELKETDSMVIASNAPGQLKFFFKDFPKVKQEYAHYYDRHRKKWDYGIFCVKTVNRSEIKRKNFPPGGNMYNVAVGDAVFATVIKRPSHGDLISQKLLKKGDAAGALAATEEYLDADPTNVEMIAQQADMYLRMNRVDTAMAIVNNGRRYYPDHVGLQFNKALIEMQQKNHASAISTLKILIKQRSNVYSAHYYLGYNYYVTGQYKLAIDAANKALGYNPNFKQAYALAAECYRKLNQPEMAKQYEAAAANKN